MANDLHRKLQRIRSERNELLKDMADKLRLGSAELSSIEQGKKSIPEGFFKKINMLYDQNF